MFLGAKLKIESKGMIATLIFYAVVGIIFLTLLPLADFAPHLGIMGIFSLIAAYGLFQKRNWTMWFVAILFCVGTTFSAYMLYWSYLMSDYVIGISMVAYVVLTWVFTIYAAARRKALES